MRLWWRTICSWYGKCTMINVDMHEVIGDISVLCVYLPILLCRCACRHNTFASWCTKLHYNLICKFCLLFFFFVRQVFGGTGYPFGRACSNKCYLFWPYGSPRQVCQIETTGDKPEPQYGQAIMLRDRYLYVIGGTTGFEYSSDIYRYAIWCSVTMFFVNFCFQSQTECCCYCSHLCRHTD